MAPLRSQMRPQRISRWRRPDPLCQRDLEYVRPLASSPSDRCASRSTPSIRGSRPRRPATAAPRSPVRRLGPGPHRISRGRSQWRPDDPPSIEGESAHYDEFNVCLGQAPQQLVEGRLVQFLSAAPVNRSSLWLSAMPSERFLLTERRASSRRLWTRKASASAAGDGLLFLGRSIRVDASAGRSRNQQPVPFTFPSRRADEAA